MKRSTGVRAAAAAALLALVGGLVTAPPAASAPRGDEGPTVFVGSLTTAQLAQATRLGLDREDVSVRERGRDGRIAVELVVGRDEAARLVRAGVPITEKTVRGTPVGRRMAQRSARPSVFRSYSQPGGIRDELRSLAAAYPQLAKLETIGTSVQGQPILAVKVTRDAGRLPDGQRPSALYISTQHAREWITTEMTRRLLHRVLESYASDASVRSLVDSRELWFVPVANPDGYDYTFTPGHRFWRKNLRDNDGDGQTTDVDGVDPNRNFPYHWGYDDEGSSSAPSSDTYRGTAAASEPETRAMVGLFRRLRPSFLLNYHSAAELLLYGTSFQVATPAPDDQIQIALAGDNARPAVPGYDPDQSAELYTTNGETDETAHQRFGILPFTAEMSTCETASAVDPGDAFDPDDCESVFSFPDSEALVAAEFEKNLPFALSLARSAATPADPSSVVGRTVPDFAVDDFAVSYGDPQPVSVTARRDLRGLRMSYSINGGPARSVPTREWQGGSRYGGELDVYFAEYRGVVRGARPGDRVKVWFTGRRPGRAPSTSSSFTYRLAEDTRNEVLVVADEDYRGVNPTYPSSVTRPKYASTYLDAIRRTGRRASLWDVTRQGVPDHLGVLGHFSSVVWYLGDNRLTQDPRDEVIDLGDEQLRDAQVARRAQDLTMSVRDYLNEGGSLVHTGETTGYFGSLGDVLGGIWYGVDGAPDARCGDTPDLDNCQVLSDDFFQYWLGAYARAPRSGPQSFEGAGRLAGDDAGFGGPALRDNPLDEAGTFVPTSDVLPRDRFPLFASQAAGTYVADPPGPFDPVEGGFYAGTTHADDAYVRLARTFDLRGSTAAQRPTFATRLSYDVEPGFDHVLVEVHPVGSDDWTTLPEVGGLTTDAVPTECEAGYLLGEHPFLEHYLTLGDDACTARGTTGAWNAMTGSSDGWKDARFDLSAYAGQQVEVVVSYVTDPAGGGRGVFVDDTRLLVSGQAVQTEGFENGLGAWTAPGPPAGSPASGQRFERSPGFFAAAVTTRRTVLLGFGVEQVARPADRARLLDDALRHAGGGHWH